MLYNKGSKMLRLKLKIILIILHAYKHVIPINKNAKAQGDSLLPSHLKTSNRLT